MENLPLVFHFSIRPRRRSCGNVGISPAFGEIPKGLVERAGSLPLAFHAFHSPGISTALRSLCWQQKDLSTARPPLRHGESGNRLSVSDGGQNLTLVTGA